MNNPTPDIPHGSIRLESIAGPPLDAVLLHAHDPAVLGRSSSCDRQLGDKTISRRHCRIARRGDSWTITDLESRHGTFLNGVQLEPQSPAPLAPGDLVRLGSCTFRVRDREDRSTATPTSNDLASLAHLVQRIASRELRSVAERRFDLLVECAAAINAAPDERDLADRLLDAVIGGTGFPRAAYIRPVSAEGDVEVFACRSPAGPGGESCRSQFVFSRSLIAAAADGEIVRLQGDSATPALGESIARMGISSAICAPIMLGDSIEAFLYLDARDAHGASHADAAAFCQAMCRMAGMALGNLKRVVLEKAQARLAADLRAAREAQRLIMPQPSGSLGRFVYALHNRPGRQVAGDLFDVFALPPAPDPSYPINQVNHTDPIDPMASASPIGVFLGDVAGKGAGSGILMAAAQSYLRAALSLTKDPGAAVCLVNEFLRGRLPDHTFITLLLAVLDPLAATLRFVDAGHGHWLLISPEGSVTRYAARDPSGRLDPRGADHALEAPGGLPLGVADARDPRAVHPVQTVPFPPGSRLVLYSDGLIEQTDPEGLPFGDARVARAVARPARPEDDVAAIARAVRLHAATDSLGDDLTVASLQLLAPAADPTFPPVADPPAPPPHA